MHYSIGNNELQLKASLRCDLARQSCAREESYPMTARFLPAACTKGGDGITYAEHINVSLAVSMPDGGLITPVIKVWPAAESKLQSSR